MFVFVFCVCELLAGFVCRFGLFALGLFFLFVVCWWYCWLCLWIYIYYLKKKQKHILIIYYYCDKSLLYTIIMIWLFGSGFCSFLFDCLMFIIVWFAPQPILGWKHARSWSSAIVRTNTKGNKGTWRPEDSPKVPWCVDKRWATHVSSIKMMLFCIRLWTFDMIATEVLCMTIVTDLHLE